MILLRINWVGGVKSILELCKDTPIVEYYESLEEGNKEENIRQREKRILQSSASMTSHYVSIVDIDRKSSIYSSFVDDRFRCVITRWRLSNHRLLIETGRYRVPKIERQHRKCYGCGVIEDERHAIYICPAFEDIRKNHLRLLEKYNSINRFLNPDPTDILEVADFLSEVDNVLNKRWYSIVDCWWVDTTRVLVERIFCFIVLCCAELWICGFVDLWLWICGLVDLWLCGFVLCLSVFGRGLNQFSRILKFFAQLSRFGCQSEFSYTFQIGTVRFLGNFRNPTSHYFLWLYSGYFLPVSRDHSVNSCCSLSVGQTVS